MKQLQNNFTTPEQSKRLLELGVPADSADCCYECSLIGGEKYYARELLDDTTFSKYKRAYDSPCLDIIPCWSVGRLMEIYDICVENTESWPTVKQGISYVINAIVAIDYAVKEGRIDFSKLEE